MKPPVPATNDETVDNLLKLASKTPPGSFVEIGIGRGGTSYLLHQLAEEQGRQLHLFDVTLDDQIQALCPTAILHQGIYPDTWLVMKDVSFCFYDIADIEGARFLINRMPTDFVKNGIALFYPFNRPAIDYITYPDWTIGGSGNMRYPFIENR